MNLNNYMSEQLIKKLRAKIEELQKLNMEITISAGKLAKKNMELEKKLDKRKK